MEALNPTTSARKQLTQPLVATLKRPKPADELRHLRPLEDSIDGLRVYGNANGDRYAARMLLHEEGLSRPTAYVEVKEISGRSREPYKVIARIVVYGNSVDIEDIRNNGSDNAAMCLPLYTEPPKERTGLGFFGIILGHAKTLAGRFGKKLIEVVPANSLLSEKVYAPAGFELDPTSVSGRMKLQLV